MPGPLFHVVLHEPQIPNNTGNVGRTCIATGCSLHLIRPLAFDTSEKACRRAGLDYWPRLGVREHDGWGEFVAECRPVSLWLFTTKGRLSYFDADLRPGDYLVFGKETAGLPENLLEAYADRTLVMPMAPGERSLNLATAVCAAVYEGIRRCVARGDLGLDKNFRIAQKKR